MSEPEIKRLETFALLALTQAAFAVFLLWNEWRSIDNSVPGGNYPMEHQSSWLRVIIFCIVPVISVLILWALYPRSSYPTPLPSMKAVLLLSAIPMAAGAVFSHYLTRVGWCCETPYAFHFGFPFSLLNGVTGFDSSVMQYVDYNLFDVFRKPGLVSSWIILPDLLILDLLFWCSIIYLLDLGAAFIFKKNQPLAPAVVIQGK